MKSPVLNIADAPVESTTEHGDAFQSRMGELAWPLGGKSIGASVTMVPPGKAAGPFHHHYANEEHFFIVRGTGTLRFGDATYPVRPGDYIVVLPGGPELAHQLVNTGSEDLVYLGISTVIVPDVVGYADSGKTGVRFLPYDPAGGGRFFVADSGRDQVGYWDGETGNAVRAIVQSARKVK